MFNYELLESVSKMPNDVDLLTALGLLVYLYPNEDKLIIKAMIIGFRNFQ